MIASPLAAAIVYADVLALWKGFVIVFGIPALAHRSNFEHENTREILLKLNRIWADNTQNLKVVYEVIQILTILMNMTFKTQMDGDGDVDSKDFQHSTWLELGESVPGYNQTQLSVPALPASMSEKLKQFVVRSDCKDLLLKELKLALNDMPTLLAHAEPLSPTIFLKFKAVNALLDDVYVVLGTL